MNELILWCAGGIVLAFLCGFYVGAWSASRDLQKQINFLRKKLQQKGRVFR